MRFSWKLATRGIVAARGRTFFVWLSLCSAAFFLTVASCFVSSIRENSELAMRRGHCGDLQITTAVAPELGLLDEIPADFPRLRQSSDLVACLHALPFVEAVAPRLGTTGLLMLDELTAPALVIGIDAELEADALPQIASQLRASSLAEGEAIVGRGLAARLDLRPGDPATLLLPLPDGLYEGDEVTVAGVYAPAGLPIIDHFSVLVSYEQLHTWLVPATGPTSLLVRLQDGSDPAQVADLIEKELQRQGHEVRVRDWGELAGELTQIVRVGSAGMKFTFILLATIAGLTVVNTSLLLLIEKTREMATMRALGSSVARILVAIGLEGTLVSIASSALGAGLGCLACWLADQIGIPAASQAMEFAFGGSRLHLTPKLEDFLVGFSLVTAVGSVSTIIPGLMLSLRAAPLRVTQR